MKYTNLKIQTQREAPNNARTEGFAFLVRAGYMTRESEILPLGKEALTRLESLSNDPSFSAVVDLPRLVSEQAVFFPLATGDLEVAHCPSCKYTELLDMAKFKKTPLPREEERPLEKVLTPDCNTIESLANFLGLPKEKTAKALMYTCKEDGKFVFVAVRGDMQLSEAKLEYIIGEIQPADAEAIARSGAVAGYASPIGLNDALILVDDLIPRSQNLAAGANEAGYHLLNTNYPRDYSAEIVEDLVMAKAGDACSNCGNPLEVVSAIPLGTRFGLYYENWLLALAEQHHDEKGLTLPKSAAPFDLYLMHVPGKQMDTGAEAEKIYNQLQAAGFSVLFDDRDERAGVKFNDADLIGCPIRVTVGEKALQNGMVELKPRKEKENKLIPLEKIIEEL